MENFNRELRAIFKNSTMAITVGWTQQKIQIETENQVNRKFKLKYVD